MAPRSETSSFDRRPEARRHRLRVWSTLLAICRSLERMQASPEARAACRAVAADLVQLRERERRED